MSRLLADCELQAHLDYGKPLQLYTPQSAISNNSLYGIVGGQEINPACPWWLWFMAEPHVSPVTAA